MKALILVLGLAIMMFLISSHPAPEWKNVVTIKKGDVVECYYTKGDSTKSIITRNGVIISTTIR